MHSAPEAIQTPGGKLVLSEKTDDSKQSTGYRILQQTGCIYDPKGRLVEIKSNGASACLYQYDPNGRLAARQFENGIVARYAYDGFGRQSRLELNGEPLTKPLLLAYQWDNAG